MRVLQFLIQKEFIQIFRNKTILPLIFIVPLVQLVILVNAATQEMKDIKLVVVDKDLSSASRQLTAKLDGSSFFRKTGQGFSLQEGEAALLKNAADVVLHIPSGFAQTLTRGETTSVQVLINAINGMAGSLTKRYTESIIRDFAREYNPQPQLVIGRTAPQIRLESSFWYNAELKYSHYMLPGILVIVVTIIGMFLTALNLVREKEMGTLEQINVTPIKKHQFIIGKLAPFWVIGLLEFGIGLLVGRLFFDLPIRGSLGLLFGFAALYLLAVMGIGLFVSTLAKTQQQVMFITYFFLLTFILMSGIFTPVEGMPNWAQQVNILNPIAYFMRVIRMVVLKGSGFLVVRKEFFFMAIYAVGILSLAVWKYRKVA